MWFISTCLDFKYALRAGTLKNKSLISMEVPRAAPVPSSFKNFPPSTTSKLPTSEASLVINVTCAISEMLASASPLNPREPMAKISFTSTIFDVACRVKQSLASSLFIPTPLSTILILERPAPSIVISIEFAFASMEFSINSLTTEAGRSITSPAAILFISDSGNTLMVIRKIY